MSSSARLVDVASAHLKLRLKVQVVFPEIVSVAEHFSKYLLKSYYMPSPVGGLRDTVTDQGGACSLVGVRGHCSIMESAVIHQLEKNGAPELEY